MVLYTQARLWLSSTIRWLRREEGVETIEWIGLAAVIIALIGVLITVMGGGGGQTIAQAIVDVITNWIRGLGGG